MITLRFFLALGIVLTRYDECDNDEPMSFLSYGLKKDKNVKLIHDPENKNELGQFIKIPATKSLQRKMSSGVFDLSGKKPLFLYAYPTVDKGENCVKYLNGLHLKFFELTEKSPVVVEAFPLNYDFSKLASENVSDTENLRNLLKILLKKLDKQGDVVLRGYERDLFKEMEANNKLTPEMANHFRAAKKLRLKRVSFQPLPMPEEDAKRVKF